jgi:flagellar biogenesis protein FliO
MRKLNVVERILYVAASAFLIFNVTLFLIIGMILFLGLSLKSVVFTKLDKKESSLDTIES